jgi:hypothetical protein
MNERQRYHQFWPVVFCVFAAFQLINVLLYLLSAIEVTEINLPFALGVVLAVTLMVTLVLANTVVARFLLGRFTDYREFGLFGLFTDLVWGYFLSIVLFWLPVGILTALFSLNLSTIPPFIGGLLASLVASWFIARQIIKRSIREQRD